jgi:hypothetical protein
MVKKVLFNQQLKVSGIPLQGRILVLPTNNRLGSGGIRNLQIVRSQFFTDMLLFVLNLVYFEYLLVYQYSDLLPMNTNK